MAAVILRERERRRQLVTRFLFFIVAYFSFGVWVIGPWLGQGLGRMFFYWGFLVLMLLFLMLLALYDALAVIGEERRKLDESRPKVGEEISPD